MTTCYLGNCGEQSARENARDAVCDVWIGVFDHRTHTFVFFVAVPSGVGAVRQRR